MSPNTAHIEAINTFTPATLLRYAAITCLMGGLMAIAETTEAAETDGLFIPLLQWESVSAPVFQVTAQRTGFAVMHPNSLFTGLYSYQLTEPADSDAQQRGSELDLLWDAQDERMRYVGVVKGESSAGRTQPSDFQAAAVAGYEWWRAAGWSAVIGGGLAVGDFGIETQSGQNWPVIPVPFIRLQSEQPWLIAQLDVLTSPNLTFTLWPSNKLRFNGDVRFDELRDARDVVSEFTLEYRFFSETDPLGDLAALAVGFKNDAFSLPNANTDDTHLQYQTWFATLDLTLLKLTAGQTFNTRTRTEDDIQQDTDTGLFVSLQGMLAF